ncbi:hypothetical protein N1851_026872 [Merluccius polli]|uniref:Uncharacterized protein n=1 Tax=Merluccius polli TaxID=89951 RepID=A0AA47MBC0_MERPO|nr:hypothetical protein N1851_026872 [Merluccius polli]
MISKFHTAYNIAKEEMLVSKFRSQILDHVDLAKEEFEALKMLISSTFMDKSYLSLWELMMTKRAILIRLSDTVEAIRISIEAPSLEDFAARESVNTWFTQGQRARRSCFIYLMLI